LEDWTWIIGESRNLGTRKIRIPKKEALKAQKALELAVNPVLSKEWIEEHSSRILAGVGVLLLILGILWGFNAYRNSAEERARIAYSKVQQNWPGDASSDRQAWDKVISELQTFLKEHSETASKLDAQLDLARAYFQTQQYEDALKWNKSVLDQASTDQDLKLLARYQQAFALEALGKDEEAINVWTALKGNGSSEITREADWNLARIYARRGDYSKAAEQYETAMKAKGGYPAADLLQLELASMKLKMKAPTDPKSTAP
jgi:predicted negative regulator of RcsB-dependent stress response